MKEYKTPEININRFEAESIVTVSATEYAVQQLSEQNSTLLGNRKAIEAGSIFTFTF